MGRPPHKSSFFRFVSGELWGGGGGGGGLYVVPRDYLICERWL
jgi:hypothetical protein